MLMYMGEGSETREARVGKGVFLLPSGILIGTVFVGRLPVQPTQSYDHFVLLARREVCQLDHHQR